MSRYYKIISVVCIFTLASIVILVKRTESVAQKLVCTDMEYFGIELDEVNNEIRSNKIREINTPDSITKILVVPTNEEIEIANQMYELLLK